MPQKGKLICTFLLEYPIYIIKKTYKFDALVVQLGMVLVRRMTVRNMLPMQ